MSDQQPRFPGIPSVINGNGAVAHVMRHVCGGVIGYPITPSTEISELFEAARTLSGPKDRALGPPAEVLAERDRRYALAARHPDPNRAVLGDPLPGRSALDRRRRGG
jgi:hypothetical protein